MKDRQLNSTTHPIVFLLVQSSDHISGATGLSPVVTLSKDGGSFASAAGAVSEIGSGWYALAGNATDRNTLGELAVHVTAAGSDPTDDKYTIVGYDPFQDLRYIAAVLFGLINNAGTSTETFLDEAGNVAVTVTVDAAGNRSVVVRS